MFKQQLLSKSVNNKLAVSSTTETFLKNQIFVDVFPIDDYEYAALWKGFLIAPFVERFQTTTLRNPYLKVLSVVETICLSDSNGIWTHNH